MELKSTSGRQVIKLPQSFHAQVRRCRVIFIQIVAEFLAVRTGIHLGSSRMSWAKREPQQTLPCKHNRLAPSKQCGDRNQAVHARSTVHRSCDVQRPLSRDRNDVSRRSPSSGSPTKKTRPVSSSYQCKFETTSTTKAIIGLGLMSLECHGRRQ